MANLIAIGITMDMPGSSQKGDDPNESGMAPPPDPSDRHLTPKSDLTNITNSGKKDNEKTEVFSKSHSAPVAEDQTSKTPLPAAEQLCKSDGAPKATSLKSPVIHTDEFKQPLKSDEVSEPGSSGKTASEIIEKEVIATNSENHTKTLSVPESVKEAQTTSESKCDIPQSHDAHAKVFVGVFGKHPAWADYMSVGLTDKHQVDIRRIILDEGVRGNLDRGLSRGGWPGGDPATDESGFIGFSHVFVQCYSGDIVLGRIWDSQDASGTRNIPLAGIVLCRGTSVSWAFEHAYEQLASLEQECRCADSKEQLKAVVARYNKELNNAAVECTPDETWMEIPASLMAQLHGKKELGPNGLGFLRIAHDMRKSLFGPSCHRSQNQDESHHSDPCNIRVPPCSESVKSSLVKWLKFVYLQIPEDRPVLIVRPLNFAWVDIILGDATTTQLFCLRASQKHLAFLTDTQCLVEDDFSATIHAITESSHAQADQSISVQPPPVVHKVKAIRRKRKRRRLLFVLMCVLFICGIGLLCVALF